MNANHSIDDELQTRQADAVIRNGGEIESAIRIADVHHDLHGNVGQRIELNLRLLEFELPS